jgi:hypothetical protein
MDLTRDDYQKIILLIIGAVLGAILAVLGNLFIWNWNKPDVRFGTGGAYIHPKLAIATVWLKNWGGSDAENVTITASLADPFTNVSTDQLATPFEPTAGGSDKKSVTGSIKRLAPGELVNIYFITEPSSPWVDQKPVVRGIKFSGGLGKTGAPWLPWLLINLLTLAVGGGIFVGLNYWMRKVFAAYYDYYSETVRIGVSAAQEGLSEEQLRMRVEQYRQTIPWIRRPGKEHIIRSALAGFAGARQSPHTDGKADELEDSPVAHGATEGQAIPR